MEEWKPLMYGDLDLTEKLEVSNTGKLRSVCSKKILSTYIHQRGYELVCISLGSRSRKKVIRVHRAVAFMFVEGYKKGFVVNHKDLNKTNNNATNLEWVTQSKNTVHALNNGKGNNRCKPKRIMCNQTKDIFESIADATRWCGLKRATSIYQCLNGKLKTAGKHPITHERLTWSLA